MKLSSPNLNYLIGAGAAILYIDILFFIVPTTSPSTVSILCNVSNYPYTVSNRGSDTQQFTRKKIAVLRLQNSVQFHVQFPTHVLEIPGNSRTSVENYTENYALSGKLTICKRSGKVQSISSRGLEET